MASWYAEKEGPAMVDSRALLVVDDEDVICHACRRIFARQGFMVDTNTDARQGLAMALEKDYEIILLDIKMPNLDGIQFLTQLRQTRSEVPVLIITGYPSIPNAAAAMRLGASDYVTKPFTSEEITSAVQRVLATHHMLEGNGESRELGNGPEALVAQSPLLFCGESWFRMEVDGSACVGAVLPGLRGARPTELRLPKIGEVVYQGLPLAGVTVPGRPMAVVAAPVSGVVMAVNEDLSQHPERLFSDPCGEGWLAHICTTEYDREAEHCAPRAVLLVNADPAAGQQQAERLTGLGCEVQLVADPHALEAALEKTEASVVFLDDSSLAEAGPDWVGLVNRLSASMRVVVWAAADGPRETAYRKRRILYYAVEPFADEELPDILAAAFRSQEAESAERSRGPSEPISGMSITNRYGHRVHLLAAPGLLWRNEGLGLRISQKLLVRALPVLVTAGVANLSPDNVLKTATAYDRLMVLLARDRGGLAGSLTRDTKPDFGVDPGDAMGKVTVLTVQPDAMGGFAGLDARTTNALADHIVWEMAVY